MTDFFYDTLHFFVIINNKKQKVSIIQEKNNKKLKINTLNKNKYQHINFRTINQIERYYKEKHFTIYAVLNNKKYPHNDQIGSIHIIYQGRNKNIVLSFIGDAHSIQEGPMNNTYSFPPHYIYKTFKEWTKIILPEPIKIHPLEYTSYLCRQTQHHDDIAKYYRPCYMMKIHKNPLYIISNDTDFDEKRTYGIPHKKYTDKPELCFVTIPLHNTNIYKPYIQIRLSYNRNDIVDSYKKSLSKKDNLSEHEKINNLKYFYHHILPSLMSSGLAYHEDIVHETTKFNTPYTIFDKIKIMIKDYQHRKNIVL